MTGRGSGWFWIGFGLVGICIYSRNLVLMRNNEQAARAAEGRETGIGSGG